MRKAPLILATLFCTGCLWLQPVRNTDTPDTADYPFPTRVGTASSTTWFWFWETGDASAEKAQKNGGITKVSSITRCENSFLGLIRRQSTTVRGN